MQTKPFRIILHLPQDAPLMLSPPPSPCPTQPPLVIPSPEFEFASEGSGSWEKTNIKNAPRSQKMSQCFSPFNLHWESKQLQRNEGKATPPTHSLPPHCLPLSPPAKLTPPLLCAPFNSQKRLHPGSPLYIKWHVRVLHKGRLMYLHRTSRRVRRSTNTRVLRCLLAF